MKLLFDQNISFRVIQRIAQNFPEAVQVREVGLQNKADIEIWAWAKREGYAIVTFDADFYDLTSLYGHPPKIIWLRIGNTSTQNLVDFLNAKSEVISSFIFNPEFEESACLEL